MKRYLPHLAAAFVALGALATVGAAVATDLDLFDAALQRPAAKSGTVVVPDRFLRSWDPVTVFFAGARGPATGGPEDHPERLGKRLPDHPGAWTWLDGRTLQFRPAEPWPPLRAWSWNIGGRDVVVSTLMEAPQRTVPHAGATGLSPVEDLELTFRDPMPPADLAQMIAIELRPLGGVGGPPAARLGPADFELKALDRSSEDAPAVYKLRLREPIPMGTRATVRLQLSVDSGSDESIVSYDFSTAEPFRVRSLGCDGASVPASVDGTLHAEDQPLSCRGETSFFVDFTAQPAPIGPLEGRNLVRFEPSVPGLGFSLQGARLVVSGEFDRETSYRMSVVPTVLQDHAGRPLELNGANAASFWFPRREASLRWGVGQGVMERLGPRRVPMQGRGHERVDLRIYKVDPLNRDLWPVNAPISVDESQRPPGPGEGSEAWKLAKHIPRGELGARLRQLGTPAISTVVRTPLRERGAGADFGLDLQAHLAEIDGRSAPGHYLVGMRTLDAGNSRSWMRIQVTDLSLTSIEEPDGVRFAVTSLATGRPVPDATVTLDGNVANEWARIARVRTGSDGTVLWKAPGRQDRTARQVLRVVVDKGDDTLVIDPTGPSEAFANGRWGRTSGGWLGWAFGSLERRGEQASRPCHIFTERPMYRPGEPVHLRGYVRRSYAGALTSVQGKGEVLVTAPGNKRWELPVELSDSGDFYVEFQRDETPTGAFTARFIGEGAACDVSFQVEAYRLPTFEATVHGPSHHGNDAPFEVELLAEYYAGGKVSKQPVRWRVTQYPYTWTPEAREGFRYSSDGRYSDGERFRSTPALTRTAVTDEQGRATLTLDPSIEPTAQPRTYVVEAAVTGADEQTITATRRVHVVPGFVLGLKLPRYLPVAERIPTELLVSGPDGALIAGQQVTLRLIHRQWHSHLVATDFTDGAAKYVTDVVDVPVTERTLTSGTTPTALDLPITRAGVYVVELESHDKLGRAQVVSMDLYAGGTDAVAWGRPKAGVFELSTDQARYRPGQTANIVIRSPYQEAQALVITEAPAGNRYAWHRVRGGQATVRVGIETHWRPQVPVHVVLMRGRNDAAPVDDALDLGKPATVASTVWLQVDPVENQVEVAVENPEKALPGSTIPVTIRLKTPEGRPLSGNVTLWLVDEAVLALAAEQRLDPLPDFIRDRGTHLAVRDSRNLAMGRLPYHQMPGGGGSEDDEGDGDAMDKATVRKNFKPVAYYNPRVRVGASGVATVQVPLPDNLTVFKVRAKATSGADRFGVGTGEIAVRLPVLVQPALPRFVRATDRFEAVGIGRIIEGGGGAGATSIEVDGLRLEGPAKRAITWDASVANRLAFPVVVETPGLDEDGRLDRDEVRVKMAVSRGSDGAADAFEVPLPLRDDRRRVVVRQVGSLAPGGRLEVPAIPEAARAGSIRRTIVASDHPGLLRMTAALDIVRHTPVGSTDQRLGRARVLVALASLQPMFGVRDGADETREAVEQTLTWLPGVIGKNGHVANWPGSIGRVTLTADAVRFLVEAKEAGYVVDDGLQQRLVRMLQAALRSDHGQFIDGESWYERAAALDALASTGLFEGAYFSELSRKAEFLNNEATARVLLAGTRARQEPAALAGLVSKVDNGVTTRLYQGKEIYAGLSDGRTYRNPLILASEARSLATLLQALARAVPDNAKNALMVDALVQVGSDDGWGNTHADAAALLSLRDWASASGGSNAVVEIVDGPRTDRLGLGGAHAAVRTSAEAGALSLSASEPVSVLVTTSYVPEKDGSFEDAAAKGFVVERTAAHLRADGPSDKHPIREAGGRIALAKGTIVEEHVRVVTPSDRHYVVITVPLAAGVEPLNPALAISGPEARPSASDTRSATWVQFLDNRVVYTFETLPKGTWDFYFRTRATAVGDFVQPAARAEMLYQPEVEGHSPGARIVVSDAP